MQGHTEIKGKLVEPPGKNYFYIQKRYSRWYFCSRCKELFAIQYRGKFDCGHYLEHYFDVGPDGSRVKKFREVVDRQFPDECPNCFMLFINPLEYVHKEVARRGV